MQGDLETTLSSWGPELRVELVIFFRSNHGCPVGGGGGAHPVMELPEFSFPLLGLPANWGVILGSHDIYQYHTVVATHSVHLQQEAFVLMFPHKSSLWLPALNHFHPVWYS